MIVERFNLQGKKVQKDLDITPQQIKLWDSTNTTSKEAFPNLSSEDLLFFDTGMTSEEYLTVLKSKGNV